MRERGEKGGREGKGGRRGEGEGKKRGGEKILPGIWPFFPRFWQREMNSGSVTRGEEREERKELGG